MESVHLEVWPEVNEKMIDEEINKQMALARQVVELGLSARAEAGIKVRQPLAQLTINNEQLADDLKVIIAEELNVKEVAGAGKMPKGKNWLIKENGDVHVALNTEITPELKQEGLSRELIRTINQMRKDARLTVKDKIKLVYATDSAELNNAIDAYKDKIIAGVLAEEMKLGDAENAVEFEIDGAKIKIAYSL